MVTWYKKQNFEESIDSHSLILMENDNNDDNDNCNVNKRWYQQGRVI